MAAGATERHDGCMDRAPRILRPATMRIDRRRCRRSGLCDLVAPGLRDGTAVRADPDTLEAMAACPSGALAWDEPPAADERRGP
jgi:ferredoxin